MATRSHIGVQNSDGSVDAIYAHWDGYPSYNGKILRDHYSPDAEADDPRAKIYALIALGDISSLAPEIGEKHDFNKPPDGVVNAYGRDRGETGVEARHFENVDDFLKYADEEYTYLLDENDEWQYRQGGGRLSLLTEDIIAND
jgi:hypothetical protein